MSGSFAIAGNAQPLLQRRNDPKQHKDATTDKNQQREINMW
jgi:hypothetical protein